MLTFINKTMINKVAELCCDERIECLSSWLPNVAKYKFNDDHAASVLGFLLSLQQQWFLSPAAKAKRVMLVIGS